MHFVKKIITKISDYVNERHTIGTSLFRELFEDSAQGIKHEDGCRRCHRKAKLRGGEGDRAKQSASVINNQNLDGGDE